MQRAFFWRVQPPKIEDKHVKGILTSNTLVCVGRTLFFQKCIICVCLSQLEVTHMMGAFLF